MPKETIIRIHPDSQERYLKVLDKYTVEELLWVIAYKYQREIMKQIDDDFADVSGYVCEECKKKDDVINHLNYFNDIKSNPNCSVCNEESCLNCDIHKELVIKYNLQDSHINA